MTFTVFHFTSQIKYCWLNHCTAHCTQLWLRGLVSCFLGNSGQALITLEISSPTLNCALSKG